MSPEVEVRIMIRDGTATVGDSAAEAALPVPDVAMGNVETEAGALSAPSPLDDAAGIASTAAADAPSPTSVGAFEGVAASGELPTPLPLDEVERLTGGANTTGSLSMSEAPSPDDSQG